MFELQTIPAPHGLDALGSCVEIRELTYGQMREAMGGTVHVGKSSEKLLGAALYVDGEPYGFDALTALPGRFTPAITKALELVLELHGLLRGPDEAPAPNPEAPQVGVAGDDGPKA
jgi:hypothetical protein